MCIAPLAGTIFLTTDSENFFTATFSNKSTIKQSLNFSKPIVFDKAVQQRALGVVESLNEHFIANLPLNWCLNCHTIFLGNNTPDSISAGAAPQTLLGELAVLPQTRSRI